MSLPKQVRSFLISAPLYSSLVVLAAILLVGCADSGGPTGSGIGVPNEGRPGSVELSVDTSRYYHIEGVGTGGSPLIYAGWEGNLISRALFRFLPPAAPDSTVRIDSARINLAWNGLYGDGEFPLLTASLLDYYWIESRMPDVDSLPPGERLGALSPEVSDSGRWEIALPLERVREWVARSDTSRADSGLTFYIVPRSGGQMVPFFSRNSATDTLRPTLHLFRTVRDSAHLPPRQDTLRLRASDDLYLIAYDRRPMERPEPSLAPDQIVVASGVVWRTGLYFDISSLTARTDSFHVVVNWAALTLFRDHNSLTRFPATRSLLPVRFTDDRWKSEYPDSAGWASMVLLPTAIDTTLDSLVLPVTAAVHQWVQTPSGNFGLELRSGIEGGMIEAMAFYGRDADDVGRRPRLTVRYTEYRR
ncbi:MAG: hypothetical protein FJY67_03270 [Calditrichaeota bacterium]|nr:hypothetical protein [Calditrichota bacterium]